jgi:hypothetical protein
MNGIVPSMRSARELPFRITALFGIAIAWAALDLGCAPSDSPATASTTAAPPRDEPHDERPFRHVLLVSVDGLRPEVLAPPLLAELPAFARLLRGAHTLDARTDADITITLPNHVGMLTGRAFDGPDGHGWKLNDDPPGRTQGGTLSANKGAYVASVFDVAHDAGLSTAVIAGKTKFWLLEQSYGPSSGAPDTLPPDFGRAKIDLFTYARETGEIARCAADRLRSAASRRIGTLDFVHFGAPDAAGHSADWIVAADSKYFAAVQEVDAALGAILAAIDATPALAGRTAIVLTTDHGGGAPAKTHTDINSPLNFRIPFLAWAGRDAAATDLYALNPARTRPAAGVRVARDESPQPIRNTDAGNLALALLGLPAVPGSTFGAHEPLRVEMVALPVSAGPDKSTREAR